jgi:putative hydrolase of the HAD superfamily
MMFRPPTAAEVLSELAKVLMLDVDGVLIRHPDPRGWTATLEDDLGVSAITLQQTFFGPHWEAISHGRATLRDRLAPVLAEIAPTIGVDRFVRYWFEHDAHIDADLLGQLTVVRAKGLQVHLATVQEHERAAYIWNVLGLNARCEAMHYAADLGSSKPAAEFYAAVEERTGFSPSDILFADDRADNVEAARARGWRAEVWTPGAQLSQLFPELA